MTMPRPLCSRRDILAGAIGAAAAGRTASQAGAKPKAASPGIGQDRLRTFMLMRGALDDRLVIGCSSGAYYGIVNGEVTPHFGFVSATFARYRPAADGGYEGVTYEVAYFTDIATGEILQVWKNPMTSEVVTVPQPHIPPARIRFTPDLAMKMPDASPGVTLNHSVAPPSVICGDVWLLEQTFVTFTLPHVPQPQYFTEIVTMHARASDIGNAHAMRVPTITYYQGIGGWRPWQKMRDRPGSLAGNGYGRYGITMAALPPNWLRITRERQPELLHDPAAPLAPLLAQSQAKDRGECASPARPPVVTPLPSQPCSK
jgi:hypothetical protein